MQVLSQEMFADWKEHPVTEALLEAVKLKRQRLHERWEAGQFTDQGQFGTAILNAKAIGQCEEILFLLELDVETLNMELADGEQKWIGTPRKSSPDQDAGSISPSGDD